MKINWKIRIKNPVFWTGLVTAIIAPILAHMGIKWSDITSWEAFGNLFLEAIKSPAMLVSIAVSVYNLIIDPTTKGVSDSAQALTYTEPKGSVEENG